MYLDKEGQFETDYASNEVCSLSRGSVKVKISGRSFDKVKQRRHKICSFVRFFLPKKTKQNYSLANVENKQMLNCYAVGVPFTTNGFSCSASSMLNTCASVYANIGFWESLRDTKIQISLFIRVFKISTQTFTVVKNLFFSSISYKRPSEHRVSFFSHYS